MGKQNNKFMQKKQTQGQRGGSRADKNRKNLELARDAAVQAERTEGTLVLEHAPVVEESAQDAGGINTLVEKYSAKVNEAIKPLLEEGMAMVETGKAVATKEDRAFVAIKVINKTQRLCMTTEGHQLKKLIDEKTELENDLKQSKVVDGVRVPAAVSATSLRQVIDNLEHQIKKVKQQIAVVICADFNLDVDEAYAIVKRFEVNSEMRVNARKGQ